MSKTTHRKLDLDEYFTYLNNTLNETKDTRTLVILSHLFVEYWINEKLIQSLNTHTKILKYDFNKKLEILDALGVFKDKKELITNIEIINKLRNICAHTLIAPEINKKINEIPLLEVYYTNAGYASNPESISQFKAKLISTILALSDYAKTNILDVRL